MTNWRGLMPIHTAIGAMPLTKSPAIPALVRALVRALVSGTLLTLK